MAEAGEGPPAQLLKARICRQGGQRMGLGLCFSSSRRFLVVTRVEQGAVKRHNDARFPGERLSPGDLVLEVNGAQGTDSMLAVLTDAGIHEFDIAFAKSTGQEACDHPELRADLCRALPEYQVSWSDVTTAVLQSRQARGLLSKGKPLHCFEVKLLESGMLELADVKPKRRGAKHESEFARISALTALIGEREAFRRHGLEQQGRSPVDVESALSSSLPPSPPQWLAVTPTTPPAAVGDSLQGQSPPCSPAPPPQPSEDEDQEFAFVGQVGGKAGARPRGKYTSSMKALAESHKKGEVSEDEFQRRAAGVFGWELATV